MIISNAQVQLQTQHHQQTTQQDSLDFQFWNTIDTLPMQDSFQLSTESMNSEAALATQKVEAARKNLELEVSVLKGLIERLTGRKMSFYVPEASISAEHSYLVESNTSASATSGSGSGMSMDYSSSVQITEKMSFSASAIIQTRDGRQIELELELNYSRELEINQNFSIRAGEALKDPLVVNFSGNSSELAAEKFEFDLDMDGQLDRIPLFKSDSAFLAHDKNHDGRINDGSELFGARTGDGFEELRRYDHDHNDWIDEHDPIFSELRLLRIGHDGKQQMVSLNEKGIGALYLNKLATPFELRDRQDEHLLGELKSSSIYVKESGEAGSLQQLDLAI